MTFSQGYYQLHNSEWHAIAAHSALHNTKKAAGDYARSIGWQRGDVIRVAHAIFGYAAWVVAQACTDGEQNTFRIPNRDRAILELVSN